MAPSTCPKCGTALTQDSRFCGKCGYAVPDPSTRTLMEYAPPEQLAPTRTDVPAIEPTGPEPQAAPPEAFGTESKVKKTMVQFPSVDAKPLGKPAPAVPPAAGSAPRVPAARTMLGMPAAGLPPPPAQQPPAPEPSKPGSVAKTMLGVAIPGVAPLNPGVPQPAAPPKVGNTMLGVAMPGIAPLQPGLAKTAPLAPPVRSARPAPPLAPIVPAPAPLVDDEALPMAPARAARTGVPMALVAGGLALVLLVGGGVLAFLWRGSSPIVAHPTLDPQGKEALHLTCEGCNDGTEVSLDDAKATFKGHEADLVLAKSLAIGANPLTLKLKRNGRDESVKIVVPIEFRIRADMTNVSAKPPVISVKVEAAPGTNVQIDGKPVTLDAHGEGSYSIDVSSEVEGPNAELKRIDKKIPYVVTPKSGVKAEGTVPAAIGITQLVLDAPGTHAVTDQKSIFVAGQTSVGSKVAINGEAVPVDERGAFAKSIEAPSAGEVPIEVVGTAPQLAARAVHFTVKRVDNLDAEARAAEASSPLLYDAVKDDVASHVGQRVVVEGEIIETRFAAGHQTILVVTDKRGCAAKADPNQCLARVLFGGEDKRHKGDKVRVFGRITRPVMAQNGKTVPEIEAEFLAKPK
jgi:hypothetical protein